MLQKLSSALREYKKRNEAVTQEGERLRKSRDALEAKCGELRAAVEGLTVEVVPLRAEYKKKSSAVESAEKRLENAKLSITTGEQELMESKREVEAATKRSEDLQQQVVRLEKEKAKRETDRIALQVKHNGTLQNVVRLEKEIAQAGTTTRNVLSTPSQKELANAKSRTTLVEKDLVEIRKERDQLLVAVKGVGLEIERLDEERMGGEKLAKETSAILESTRKEMDSTRTRLEREVASLRDEKEDHLAVIRRLQEAEDRKRREVKITTKNGEEMERLKKDLEKTEVERNDFEERLLAQETEKKKIEQRIGEGEKERKILMANLKSSRAEKVQWAEDRSKSMLEKDSLRSVKSRVEQEVADLLLEQEKDQVKIRTLREGTDGQSVVDSPISRNRLFVSFDRFSFECECILRNQRRTTQEARERSGGESDGEEGAGEGILELEEG